MCIKERSGVDRVTWLTFSLKENYVFTLKIRAELRLLCGQIHLTHLTPHSNFPNMALLSPLFMSAYGTALCRAVCRYVWMHTVNNSKQDHAEVRHVNTRKRHDSYERFSWWQRSLSAISVSPLSGTRCTCHMAWSGLSALVLRFLLSSCFLLALLHILYYTFNCS